MGEQQPQPAPDSPEALAEAAEMLSTQTGETDPVKVQEVADNAAKLRAALEVEQQRRKGK